MELRSTAAVLLLLATYLPHSAGLVLATARHTIRNPSTCRSSGSLRMLEAFGA